MPSPTLGSLLALGLAAAVNELDASIATARQPGRARPRNEQRGAIASGTRSRPSMTGVPAQRNGARRTSASGFMRASCARPSRGCAGCDGAARPGRCRIEFQDALFRHQGECAQPELYQVARAGTKRVVGEYFDEIESCFAYLLALKEPGVNDRYRLAQVKRIGRVVRPSGADAFRRCAAGPVPLRGRQGAVRPGPAAAHGVGLEHGRSLQAGPARTRTRSCASCSQTRRVSIARPWAGCHSAGCGTS